MNESSLTLIFFFTTTGSMLFVADDNLLEEMIIGYGDIDTDDRRGVLLDDGCDLLSDDDEGVFVVERTRQLPQQEPMDPIEMKVKSIEMHHLTAQSANNEKEDFERIEMDVYDCSGLDDDFAGEVSSLPLVDVSKEISSSAQQEDSGVEEETESSDYGEWLHPRPTAAVGRRCEDEQVVPVEPTEMTELNKVDIHMGNLLDNGVDRMSEISESKKVPLWLKSCEEPTPKKTPTNPWIRNNDESTSLLNDEVQSVADVDMCIEPTTAGPIEVSADCSSNMARFNDILSTSNAAFLIREHEKPLSSLSSDFSLIDFTDKFTTETTSPIPVEQDKPVVSATDEFDYIFNADNSSFLRPTSNNNNNATNNLAVQRNENHSDFLLPKAAVSIQIPSSPLRTNLSHMEGILGSESSQFLAQRPTTMADKLPSVRPSTVVNYLRSLESKPNSAFLRNKGKRTASINADMCEWLRSGGPSSQVERCSQCSDITTCENSGIGVGLGPKWIKTATDW